MLLLFQKTCDVLCCLRVQGTAFLVDIGLADTCHIGVSHHFIGLMDVECLSVQCLQLDGFSDDAAHAWQMVQGTSAVGGQYLQYFLTSQRHLKGVIIERVH